MNRPVLILSRLALYAAIATVAPIAHAQQGYGQGYPQNYGPQNGQRNNGAQNQNARNANNGGEGLLPLPQGVSRVVGIDAQNVLLVEMEPEVEGGPSEYRAIPVRHVYVGGIAKLFGGTTISTEEFVSPAFSKGAGFGQNNNNAPGNFTGNGAGANGFGNGLGQGNNNGFQDGYNNGFAPNGGFTTNGNGFVPNGGTNLNGAGFGGFTGSPQVSYGVGNFLRSRRVPNQGGSSTVQEGR